MKIPLAIIIGAIIIGAFIYFSRTSVSPISQPKITPPVATFTSAPTATAVPSTPTPTVDDSLLLKQALLLKTGIPEANFDYTISFNDGKIAKGSVKNKTEMSGAAWFAGKSDGKWIIAYVGQGVPKCSEIADFNFPVNWLSHCVNVAGTTVAR